MPELPLFSLTSTDVVNTALAGLQVNTNLDNLSPGSKMRAVTKALGDIFATVGPDVQAAQLATLITRTTNPSFVEAMGEILGVPRQREETAAAESYHRAVRLYTNLDNFGLINDNEIIYITAGALIISSSTDVTQNVSYTNTEPIELAIDDKETFISVRCMTTGFMGNVSAGDLNTLTFSGYTDSANATLLVSNSQSIVNGSNQESLENYKYRITNHLAFLARGNTTAIRIAALNVPGVRDVELVPHGYGIGTSIMIVTATTPSVPDSLISQVEVRVRAIESTGNYTLVSKPEEVGVSLELTVNLKTSGQRAAQQKDIGPIEQAIRQAVSSFINNLPRGNTLFQSELINVIKGSDERIVDIGREGKHIDNLFIYRESPVNSSRAKYLLTWNYACAFDEKLLIEPSLETPIAIRSIFIK